MLEELSDYLDGIANETICAEIEMHIAECPDCKIMIDTLNKTITLYRGHDHEILPPTEVRDRLYRTLDLEEYLPPQSSKD
jgi:predicted anti-sigma-YlaC factor YlaD